MPTDKTITIPLTDRAPVAVSTPAWPTIARASWSDDPRVPSQSNRRRHLYVRQHADGRAVVSGRYQTQWQGEADLAAGEILEPGADIAAAIRRVATAIGCDDPTIAACIADLPAVALDEDIDAQLAKARARVAELEARIAGRAQ